MRLRLNRWQRIGIVLSVMWFIGFEGYIWHIGNRNVFDFYSSSLHMCSTILDTDNEALQYIEKTEDRNKRQTDNWTKYGNCQTRADALMHTMVDGNNSGIPILFVVAFLTVLFGWLVVSFVIGITQLIKVGFAHSHFRHPGSPSGVGGGPNVKTVSAIAVGKFKAAK